MPDSDAWPAGFSGPGPAGGDEPGPVWLTAGQEAGQDQFLDGYLAATAADEPPDEQAGMWVDPDTGPPMGAAFGLGQLPQELLADALAGQPVSGPPPVAVPFLEDVAGHDGSGPGGP